MTKIKSVRGMQDIIPSSIGSWQILEKNIRDVFTSYGYEEIRFPVMEYTNLFDRSIGELTDIVSKEMYTFSDRGGESISLRPEGTAGCLRACLNNDLIRTDSPKLWYMGPMFRYERPQKGRLRQFHQASVEAYGIQSPNIEVEMILIASRLWKRLNLENYMTLEINSLGDILTREKYIKELKAYLNKHKSKFSEEELIRIEKNPLRILDSKSPNLKDVLDNAPQILDFLEKDSRDYLDRVTDILEKNSIKFSLNPNLVRGLDYYNDIVFEWKTSSLGSQDAVCGGGRYDRLVEEISGKKGSAVGFSIGMERIIILLDDVLKLNPNNNDNIDGYFICLSKESFSVAQNLSEEIRNFLPTFSLKVHYGQEKLKSQLKKANKLGANLALILGEDELKGEYVTIKYLKHDKTQEKIPFSELSTSIEKFNE